VALRVRFVEASRTQLRALGVNLAAVDGTDLRVLTGIANPTDFLSGENGLGTNALGVGASGEIGDASIDALVTALERRGVVRILSEPTLTTTSGKRATFRAGGEFAFPVNQGNDVITAQYRSFGVSLDFLPVVLPNNRIAIEVAPEVSFIDADVGVQVSGFNAPGLSVRSATTTVEVGSGQTFAIAGLYEQFATDSDTGIPGTRDSLLRGLFGTTAQRREERELIILITPYLVEASDAVEAARPPHVKVSDTVGFILQ
jgi:pilus assembly protein CpaC